MEKEHHFDIEDIKNKMRLWVELDKELKEHKKIIKEINIKRKLLDNDLVKFMKSQQIDSIDINNGVDRVIYQKRTLKSSISKKLLENSLNEYFSGSGKAEEISNYILNNRKENIKETIIRK